MDTPRVEQHWRETFDVAQPEFGSPGILVHANPGRAADRNAAWILVHGDSVLVSVPPALLQFVQEAIQSFDFPAILFGN